MSILVLGLGSFGLGLYGVLTRREIVAILACVEVMIGGALIVLAGLGANAAPGSARVEATTLLMIVLAAAEAALGLALVVSVARSRKTTRVDELTEVRG